jgi:hypothetical protein
LVLSALQFAYFKSAYSRAKNAFHAGVAFPCKKLVRENVRCNVHGVGNFKRKNVGKPPEKRLGTRKAQWLTVEREIETEGLGFVREAVFNF